MSSFLSPEDFNEIMNDDQVELPAQEVVITQECSQAEELPMTIPVEELLQYGAEATTVPHQGPSIINAPELKPVKTVRAVTPTHDPKAKPTCGLNLRLNEYQLELIRKMADKEERSMQQIVKRMLIPALENALTEAA